MKKSELKALIREVIEEMGARSSSPKNNPSDDLKRLGELIRQAYPHLDPQLDSVDDEMILEIYTEETDFYIRISGYKNGETLYGVDARWPQDEKGKKRLNADQMVKAIATIPGVSV